MRIEYLCTIGNLQYKGPAGPKIVNAEYQMDDSTIPAADVLLHPSLIQDLASSLWAIPETRETTPHRKLAFSTSDCVVKLGDRVITPESDLSAETPEVQAFVNTIYEHDNGHYANEWALRQVVDEPASPEPLTPGQAKAAKRNIIHNDFAAVIKQMTASYPEDEVKSWDQQEKEAKAFSTDPEADTPLLDNMAQSSGETKEELATLIIGNAAAFAQFYGQALGIKRSRVKALNAIDLEAADAIEQIAAV